MSRILVLESDKLLAGNLVRFLKKSGHNAVWRADSQSAIYEVDTHRPDAIIMDLLLATHNGVEFLYELRSYPEWNNIPVILFTSSSSEDLAHCQEALNQLQIFDYHYKPATSLAKLGQSLSSALEDSYI